MEFAGAKDKEIERLKADNAELVRALGLAKAAMWRGEFGDKGRDRDTPAAVDAALASPRPGAALLEELTRLRAQVATLTKCPPGVET